MKNISKKAFIRMAGISISLIASQLNALLDLHFHPEYDYFIPEHLIQGIIIFIILAVATLVLSNLTDLGEKEKKRINENLKNIIDELPVLMLEINKEGRIRSMMGAICNVLGLQEKNYLHQSIFIIFRNIPKLVRCIQDSLEGFHNEEIIGFEGLLREKFLMVSSFPLINDKSKVTGAILFGIDMSDWKKTQKEKEKLETELRQSQKMEAIGTLAGGIAHDFNNILSIILGYTEITYNSLADDNVSKEYLKNILDASKRAADLVHQILTFSQKSDIELRPLYFQPVLKQTIKFLRSTLPANIEIRQNLNAAQSMVLADLTQLHQIIMNLGTNAKHAMEENGGILEFELKEVLKKDSSTNEDTDDSENNFLLLKIADTGHGIQAKNLGKIFEPYFTTKEKGKGTGLGLSLVYGIIKKYGGDISVKSSEGKGTEFTLLLPLFQRNNIQMGNPTESTSIKSLGNILLVDDEEHITSIQSSNLNKLGYEVDAFQNSLKALDAFCINPHKYDLVISDLVMPKLSGNALAEKIKEIRPELPVLLITGFRETPSIGQLKDLGCRLLRKPFTQNELAKILSEIG